MLNVKFLKSEETQRGTTIYLNDKKKNGTNTDIFDSTYYTGEEKQRLFNPLVQHDDMGKVNKCRKPFKTEINFEFYFAFIWAKKRCTKNESSDVRCCNVPKNFHSFIFMRNACDFSSI